MFSTLSHLLAWLILLILVGFIWIFGLIKKRKEKLDKKFALEEIPKIIVGVIANIVVIVLIGVINVVQALQEINVVHILQGIIQGIKTKALVLYKRIF